MTDRAVSTVVDVCLCLLLVSASVVTLFAAPAAGDDPAAGTADELASTLAGGTTTVRYEGTAERRAVHGTYAGLLATAARTNRTPGTAARTNRTPKTGERFRAAVRNATRRLLSGDGWRGRVRATWRPYRGAGVTAVVAGPSPPPGADVHAATTSVPSGLRPVAHEARRAAARSGYRGVAVVLADVVVPGADGARRRAYVRRTAADLERRFDSPLAAARATTVGRVRITVRTWSP